MFMTNRKNFFHKIITVGAAAYNEFFYKKYPFTTNGFLSIVEMFHDNEHLL